MRNAEDGGRDPIANECEQRGEKSIERAVDSEGALTAIHFGVAVPKLATRFGGEVFVEGWNAGIPHVKAIVVAVEGPAFPEVFITGIDGASDVAGGLRSRDAPQCKFVMAH